MKSYITYLILFCIQFFSSCSYIEPKYPSFEDLESNEQSIIFQKKSLGEGITVILIADGYHDEAETLYNMYELLFKEPPYTSLKKYFNVIGLIGTDSLHLGITTQKDCYAANYRRITEIVMTKLKLKSMNNTCVAIAVSPDLGNKRSISYLSNNKQYPTLALCRWANCSEEYRQYIISHEIGGHCLAGLEDEYIEFKGTVDKNTREEIQAFQKNGLFENVSLNPNHVPWQEMLYLNLGYEDITIIEGALYEKGIYKSSEESIMSSRYIGFNTVSRYLIWKNIHEKAGLTTTISQFLNYDIINRWKPDTRSTSETHCVPDSLLGATRRIQL